MEGNSPLAIGLAGRRLHGEDVVSQQSRLAESPGPSGPGIVEHHVFQVKAVWIERTADPFQQLAPAWTSRLLDCAKKFRIAMGPAAVFRRAGAATVQANGMAGSLGCRE